MRITATFIDEISYDIPHQNWGSVEWDNDFKAMKNMGIDTVVVIRCGLRRWITYQSKVLSQKIGAVMPEVDLVDLFLTLAEKYDMKLMLGTYDSGFFWAHDDWENEIAINLEVIKEAWELYGARKAFGGWYLSLEVSRRTGNISGMYKKMGHLCKDISGGLPILISPFIQGDKTDAWDPRILTGEQSIQPEEHEREWRAILEQMRGIVDIVAFQDGHVDFFTLAGYLEINRKLCNEYGIECWTNCESFDREMPIKFLPLKWEKMLYKLRAAEKAGFKRAITFEFSHFMSPNSIYGGAHGLYNRYREYFGITDTIK